MRSILASIFAFISYVASLSEAKDVVPSPMKDVNNVIDNTIDSINKARTVRPVAGSTRIGDNPVLFLIGNSTMRTGTLGNGQNGQWGWGSVLHEMFDTTRISIENYATSGGSARSFMDEGRWDKVYNAIRPGDYVLIQFGHNDDGPINKWFEQGELPGAGEESQVFSMESSGRYKVVYTYGWYLRKYIMDAKEKGAIPIIVTPTVRNKWNSEGKIESNSERFGKWARQAAMQGDAYFIDLNAMTGKKLQSLGKEKTASFFWTDGNHRAPTHTSKAGARLNASSVADGLRDSNCSLKNYLKPMRMEFDMSEMGSYNDFSGYGYDFNTKPGDKSYYFSVKVPDGNYKITLTFGNEKKPSVTTVRAESRRLMLDRVKTEKGDNATRTIMVQKRTPTINLSDTVRINPREVGTTTWDDKLTLEFTGSSPAVQTIVIEPADSSVVTVFLCGNSTVVDQVCEPWASWGQIIPAFFNENVVIANHAESGERTSSFLSRKRLDKVLSMARPGDWVLMEFGHNDQKDKGEGCGAWYNFSRNLKIFIDRVRAKGLNPLLLTPTARRAFDENGKVTNTHGEYVDAIRAVAQRENVPMIDLNPMTMQLYESLGAEGSKKAFVHYPDGRFPGQTGPLADNTHFNPYGATQVAKCVVEGLRTNVPELAGFLNTEERYDPALPDSPELFVWPESPFYDNQKPYGN